MSEETQNKWVTQYFPPDADLVGKHGLGSGCVWAGQRLSYGVAELAEGRGAFRVRVDLGQGEGRRDSTLLVREGEAGEFMPAPSTVGWRIEVVQAPRLPSWQAR